MVLLLCQSGVAQAGILPEARVSRADTIHDAYPAPVIPFDADEPVGQPDDDLARAIADAYQGNPVLAMRRYELRATDDALGTALSQTRASAQVQLSAGYQFTDPGRLTNAMRSLQDQRNSPTIRRNDLGAQIIVDQPVSTGGRASATIAAARADILAGRQSLRGSEGDLLVAVITAYCDVRLDRRTLGIREKNVDLLAATLDEVIARREAGQLTRTDIAQAQTQLEAARVALNAARARYEESRASFVALVGREPGVLATEPPLPLLPATMDAAFEDAEQFNPDMASAMAGERASRARIAAARAEKNPTLDIRGTAGTTGPLSPFYRYNEDVSYGARATLSIPITTGGRTSAQIAQALDRNSADRLRIEATRRQMVQAIITAWNQTVTARRNVGVQEVQLKAARVFYEGTFEEYREGLRSTFDMLFAQNGLRETEIGLLSTRRDQYVAQANLLRQIGQLEVSKIVTGTGLYDPTAHVRTVERSGALPWDAGFRVADGVFRPGQQQQRLEQPERIADVPRMSPGGASPADQLMSKDLTVAAPGTTGVPLQPTPSSPRPRMVVPVRHP